MRFELHQIYPFVQIEFQYKNGNKCEGTYGTYKPWDHKLLKINIINPMVVEQHAVAWEYDEAEEKKYEGYVFISCDDVRYFNQYPRASYSQTSTESDYRLTRDVKNSEDLDKLIEQEVPCEFMLLTHYLEKVLRGIYQLKQEEAMLKEKGETCDPYADQLKAHYDAVVKQYEEATSNKVTWKNSQHGERICPDWFIVTIEVKQGE